MQPTAAARLFRAAGPTVAHQAQAAPTSRPRAELDVGQQPATTTNYGRHESHADSMARLERAHARKSAFWSLLAAWGGALFSGK